MAEYKADEGKLKEVCSILKAVLTSFGGELPIYQIDGEYKTVVGCSIPYKELKHGTLASFLQSIPDALRLENRGGKLVVTVVNDENIDLILQQVRGQNESKCKKTVQKKKKHTEFAARQLHANPTKLPLYNTRWQRNTVWQSGPSHTPAAPARPRLNPNVPNYQWRALRTNTPTGFRPSAVQSPQAPQSPQSVGLFSTPVHKGTPEQQQQQQQSSVIQENMKTKAAPAEKTPIKRTLKQQLIEEVKQLDSQMEPEFKTVLCGKKMEWCSVILIGDMRVSSYPDLAATQEEAEEAASKKALQVIPQLAKKTQVAQLPTTADYSVSVQRVKQLLKERSPNKRFWWEALQELYYEVHQERLPTDWMANVRSTASPGLTFDNPCVDKWTVALAAEVEVPQGAAKAKDSPPSTPTPSPQNDKPAQNHSPPPAKPQMPTLVLPTTPTWDVFVTCVEGGNIVRLLLVGKEYSSMYSELQTEMELHYMEEKNHEAVKEPVVGEIYVASHEESWLRVEVEKVLEDEVQVKFVDHGDMEIIPLSHLYHLQERFFSLPPQALQCCLAGLEDAPQEAAFQALMECLPMGKTLVARVQRRQEPYAVVLFDTSTNEDVNLNEKVFESLALHLVEPSLPPVGGLAEVYLTHASTQGTLYVQVESKTYKILEDLLKIAKRRTEEMLGEKVPVDLTKLYLARFSKDGEWYRAAPRSVVEPDGKALPCCLHNVPANPELKWTEQACQRLLDLASPDTPLLLKVVSEGTTSRHASVQLFKRLLPQNELVSINDTLGIDTKLFGSEGDSNNNSVEKEVVFSQFRSQQQPSSASSGGASQSVPAEWPPVGPDSFPPCCPLLLSDIPDVGSFFDVFVTFAANPFHFAVQPWKMSKKFNDLSESMQSYYNNPANLKRVEAIESNQYCAIKHLDDYWYRAKVEMVITGSVTGLFVDYGDRFYTTLDNVQPLTPAFCTLPGLAIKAGLHGIKPLNADWSPEDACRFRELVGNKELVSKVMSRCVKNDSIYLSLVLTDTSDKTDDVCIRKVLVGEGRAVCSEQ